MDLGYLFLTFNYFIMGFQIKNAKGEAIPINVLDEEVCSIWNVVVQKKSYASPKSKKIGDTSEWTVKQEIASLSTVNWFDCIGYAIHCLRGGEYVNVTWNAVIASIADNCGADVLGIEEIDYFKPYLEVIKTWRAAGYTPVAIVDL